MVISQIAIRCGVCSDYVSSCRTCRAISALLAREGRPGVLGHDRSILGVLDWTEPSEPRGWASAGLDVSQLAWLTELTETGFVHAPYTVAVR